MSAKKKASKRSTAVVTPKNSFAQFLADPMIATALIVFALIALMLSILEFTNSIAL